MNRKYFALIVIGIIVIVGMSAESLHAAGKIKTANIGWVEDVSGPYSIYGKPTTNAAEYAIEYINKVLYPDGLQIGEDRYHFKLVVMDYAGKIEEAPMAGQRALDKGIFALCTGMGVFLEPIYGKLAAMKVPMMLTYSPFMTEKMEDPWIFRYRNTPTQLMPATAWYVIKEFGLKRPSVYSETGAMGTAGGQQWVDSVVKAGIPRENIYWQQYKYPLSESQFLPYLTKSMEWGADVIVHGATGEGSGTPQACAIYLQGKELGYTGYFCSFTGMTDVEARKILGPNYALYLTKVYQGEGVDAYTNPDPAIRQWGMDYFTKYDEYPIDLVPWGWDIVMVLVSAAYRAGTVTDGDKYREALAELPFDFLLKPHLKTPMNPQRKDKLFDAKGQALMEVMVCGWTKEGIKIPKAFMFVDENTMEISSVAYPKQDLIDSLIKEWRDRQK
jgi:ABC-type branched-subunit amino acid transport system substrate-binding protein